MDTETELSGAGDGSDDADGGDAGAKGQARKHAGSSKRSKTQQLTIHETLKVAPKVSVRARASTRKSSWTPHRVRAGRFLARHEEAQ